MFEFNKNNKINYLIIAGIIAAIFGAGFFIGKAQVVCPVCKPENIDFSLFWDAYNKLNENYINPGEIEDQKVIYGAISGMAESLGDPYTDFFDPKKAKMFEQELLGSFEGIGVEVGMKKGQLTVIAPLKGTPGEKAGLKAGDQIIKINGESAADMSIDEAVNMIRGRRGTEVTITVFRDGWTDIKDFKIIRDVIKIHSVEWELKEGNIAYIRIYQFGQPLISDFKKIARQIVGSPAKKIILDLRGNPGGYLESAEEFTGWFLKSGQVVTLEDFGEGKEKKEYKAQGNAQFSEYPTVVLIDNGSASAAEILAGALRDQRNIKLVGEKSFGKGSVQKLVELMDGKSFLKITIAKWLTPKGISISDSGLEPDVKIEISDKDKEADKDSQLDKALEIIKNLQ